MLLGYVSCLEVVITYIFTSDLIKLKNKSTYYLLDFKFNKDKYTRFE